MVGADAAVYVWFPGQIYVYISRIFCTYIYRCKLDMLGFYSDYFWDRCVRSIVLSHHFSDVNTLMV